MLRILLVVLVGLASGCRPAAEDAASFAIFLVVNPSGNLQEVQLADRPILTEADIVSYDWATHTVELSDAGLKRLPTSAEVGTGGKRFVVVANGRRCYQGAFWTAVSSVACPNPVIDVMSVSRTITNQRAYPSEESAESEDDPRSDKRVLEALTRLKKLRDAR